MNISNTERLQSAAPAALRVAINILKSWSCTTQQMAIILNISEVHLQEFVKQNDKIDLSEEQSLRLSYLLNIYECIQQIFNNPDNKDRYMSLKNHNKPFQGKTPLEYILEGNIERLQDTYQHLASWMA